MTTRFRSLLWLSLAMSVFASGTGCSCDPSLAGSTPDPDGGMDSSVTCTAPAVECTPPGGSLTCVTADPDVVCPYSLTGYNGGTCPESSLVLDTATCTFTCGTPAGSACVPPIPMQPGYLSQYIDSVTVDDGAGGEFVAISGYSPGWLDSGNFVWPYGDLVYVEYRPGTAEVPPATDYIILDGKPADSESNIFFDPAGWRGGNYEPGEDVGYYTSIAASPAGDVYIAYVDLTTRGSYKLKLAHRAAGAAADAFTLSVIDDSPLVATGGALFPSLTLSNGVPVVAYGVREQATAAGGQPNGWVRVATATTASPAGTSDWTSFDLVETITRVGCVEGDGLCATGDRCAAAGTSGRGECVTPSTDCRGAVTMQDPAGAPLTCSGMFGTQAFCQDNPNWGQPGEADTCRNVKGGSDLIDATGLFNHLVPSGNGLALAYHDRGAGAINNTGCETDAQCGAQEFCFGATTTSLVDNDGRCMVPNGNLWGLRFDGTNWSSRFLIDGYSRKAAAVGDCGQHLTFTIDGSGVWHVAYLDGTYDRVRYAQVQTNNTVNNYQIVDDGTAAFAPALTDRLDGNRRLVGGEMAIQVAPNGELRLLYQDLTGPTNTDPLVQPIGPQPLLATRAAGTPGPFTVGYATTNAPNSGFWISQTLGITAATTGTSYCVWAQRAANSNDPSQVQVEDGAQIHVTTCRVSP